MISSEYYKPTQVAVWCVLSAALILSALGHGGEEHENPKLIIISFDGFRWDYLSRTDTPNFDRIIQKGVRARYGIRSSYITKTLPNHMTLVTGMYEESHGIVGNTMYDPVLKETFHVSNLSQKEAPRWFDMGSEPIWVTNQLQKKQGRSGCMQWIGCDAPIKGVVPTRHIPFDPTVKNETRIDQVLSWFSGSYPVNLGLIYFSEPDHTAHGYGPDSEQVTAMIGGLDKVVGYLLDKLEEADLLDDMNLIITSDHGFTETSKDRVVNLDDYINPDTYRIFSTNPVATILPNDGMEDEIFKSLSNGAEKTSLFTVYQKDTVPQAYHFSHNRRIMPIIVEAKEHYSISFNGTTYIPKGEHGYNNSLQSMHPFFIAMGPKLRQGAEVATFPNVDVYPLMCHLLHLHPAPNNGSLDAVRSLLRDDDHHDKTTFITFGTYLFVLLVIGSVGGVFSVAACRQHRYLKRMQRTKLVSLEGGVKYSIPPSNGGAAKVPLLSDTSEEESFH